MSSAASAISDHPNQSQKGLVSPEFIYFDLGNVLLYFDHEIAVRQMASLVDRPTDLIREVVFQSELQTDYETGRINDEEFHSRFCDAVSASCKLVELKHAASDIFRINPGTFQIAARLHTCGYRLGILSNTCHAHWEFISSQTYWLFEHVFEQEILSYEVGSMKPDSKIYQAAIDAAKLAPEQIFFMDDRQENVNGAIEAGMDAVLFENSAQLNRELFKRIKCL